MGDYDFVKLFHDGKGQVLVTLDTDNESGDCDLIVRIVVMVTKNGTTVDSTMSWKDQENGDEIAREIFNKITEEDAVMIAKTLRETAAEIGLE